MRSGFQPSFIDEWIAELEHMLPWSHLPGKDALMDLIAALHHYSWMSTEGLDGVTRLKRGSLAGNPLGDIIFSAGMTVVLTHPGSNTNSRASSKAARRRSNRLNR